MKINLVNDQTGMTKQVKKGISWTTFFFGFFVPLTRGDGKWFAVMAAIQVILALFTYGVGSLFVSLFFTITYNNLYIKDLIENGYKPADEFSATALQSLGYKF